MAMIILSATCSLQVMAALTLSLDPIRMMGSNSPNLILYSVAALFLFLLFLSVNLAIPRNLIVSWVIVLLCSIIALINYYELIFHGTVFTHQDIGNFTTAAGQMSNLSFQITRPVQWIILSFFFIQFVIAALYFKRVTLYRNRLWAACSSLLLIALVYILILSPGAIVNKYVWSWEKRYYEDSYVIGTIENLQRYFRPLERPDGYQASAIEGTCLPHSRENRPDIIMILNETYYDIDHLDNFALDVSCNENYKAMNAFKGYASVPFVGGGTNASEYELLTGNSLSLLNTSTPFNDLSFTDSRSIVEYLEKLGYATMAAHSEPSRNYHRGKAWKELGFDACHFKEDFITAQYYGNRPFITDIGAFANFRSFYEKMPEDQPRFAYLLTIQNHTDWNSNGPEMDLIHVGNSHGLSDYDNQRLNEYLSCVKQTDQFLNELEEYFSGLDREVLVYMVGDHCPSIFLNLPEEDKDASETIQLKKRQVPYFIWTNYDYDASNMPDNHEIDLCALSAYALKAAGLPISAYYNQLIEASKTAQCFTRIESKDSEGKAHMGYVDIHGQKKSNIFESQESVALKNYFYMEYNNLRPDRRDELFDPEPEIMNE